MAGTRILVLGGTREGRELAGALALAGYEPVTSFAGRTRAPVTPAGSTRSGGFGGVDGLIAWLTDAATRPRAVVDASHPYAARMSANAAAAAAATGVALVRLDRPGWEHRPDAAGWHWVNDHEAAAALVARGLGSNPFLTIGRQGLPAYAGPLGDLPVLARIADLSSQPWGGCPPRWTLLAERGPFTLDAESALFARHRLDVLVTKDSGGTDTVAKLDAAAACGVPVVMLRRPTAPARVPTVPDVAGALSWCARYR